MLLTPRGIGFYRNAKNLIELSQKLIQEDDSISTDEGAIISIASISFLNSVLLPKCLMHLKGEDRSTRYRLLDVPTDSMVSDGLNGAFEACIHFKKLSWPKSWTSTKIGKLKSGLFAKANHPLLPKATEKEVLQHPFVIPTYWLKLARHSL